MQPRLDRPCTAFAGLKKIASGNVIDVALKVKEHQQKDKKTTILVFDNTSSQQVELDLRGNKDAIIKRMKELPGGPSEEEEDKTPRPGRPKLGVVSREISLLPRHWEWLATQPGGASVTLRKLVEEAKKKNVHRDQLRLAQEATYKFMVVMAGDLPHYEEALRALYAKNAKEFAAQIVSWPKDVREHTARLAENVMRVSRERPDH